MNPTPEQLLYTLPQSKKRVLIPKIVTLLVLGTIFYLGILLNISLLDLSAAEETEVNLISLIILLLVIFLGVYLEYRQASQNYNFYSDKLVIGKKEVYYYSIQEVTTKKNFLDKLFKTYTIKLGNNVILKNIPSQVQVEDYIQQLINYTRKS